MVQFATVRRPALVGLFPMIARGQFRSVVS